MKHPVFHSSLAPTCFSLGAIIREFTPILLKLTVIRLSYNVSYHIYKLHQNLQYLKCHNMTI